MIEAGKTLLHYRLIEKLGEGGMGVVWKGLDTDLDREVAIKILPPDFAEDAERLGQDLAQALARGPIPLDETVAIMDQIARALQTAQAGELK